MIEDLISCRFITLSFLPLKISNFTFTKLNDDHFVTCNSSRFFVGKKKQKQNQHTPLTQVILKNEDLIGTMEKPIFKYHKALDPNIIDFESNKSEINETNDAVKNNFENQEKGVSNETQNLQQIPFENQNVEEYFSSPKYSTNNFINQNENLAEERNNDSDLKKKRKKEFSGDDNNSSSGSDKINELINKRKLKKEKQRKEKRIKNFEEKEEKRKIKQVIDQRNKNKNVESLRSKLFIFNGSIYLDEICLNVKFSWNNIKPSSTKTFACSKRDNVCKAKVKIEKDVIVQIMGHEEGYCQGKKTLDKDIAKEVEKINFFKKVLNNHPQKINSLFT